MRATPSFKMNQNIDPVLDLVFDIVYHYLVKYQ
jgi:hypothetical protein